MRSREIKLAVFMLRGSHVMILTTLVWRAVVEIPTFYVNVYQRRKTFSSGSLLYNNFYWLLIFDGFVAPSKHNFNNVVKQEINFSLKNLHHNNNFLSILRFIHSGDL